MFLAIPWNKFVDINKEKVDAIEYKYMYIKIVTDDMQTYAFIINESITKHSCIDINTG